MTSSGMEGVLHNETFSIINLKFENGERYLTHLVARLIELHHEVGLQIVVGESSHHLCQGVPGPIRLEPFEVFGFFDFSLFVRGGILYNYRGVIVI